MRPSRERNNAGIKIPLFPVFSANGCIDSNHNIQVCFQNSSGDDCTVKLYHSVPGDPNFPTAGVASTQNPVATQSNTNGLYCATVSAGPTPYPVTFYGIISDSPAGSASKFSFTASPCPGMHAPATLCLEFDQAQAKGNPLLKKPIVLRHSGSYWLSDRVDTKSGAAFWLFQKTGDKNWTLTLKEIVGVEVASYHAKESKNEFPLPLKKGKINVEAKNWPDTIEAAAHDTE